jgi:hypothetical protein
VGRDSNRRNSNLVALQPIVSNYVSLNSANACWYVSSPEGASEGVDCILVATHPSGLEFCSIVALKSALVPFRKHPALRGSCKKGDTTFSIFLSDRMKVRNPSSTTFVLE